MTVDLGFDAGRIDVIFSGDGNYSNHTLTMEQAIDLSDSLREMVTSQCGERSPRVYDAENEHLERILHASNMLGAIATVAAELRVKVQEWTQSRDSYRRAMECKSLIDTETAAKDLRMGLDKSALMRC